MIAFVTQLLGPFFAHPWLFAGGVLGVSVPVVIHILNRRRFKVMEWAAMRFLLDAIRKNRRRLRIEELILLALRCLIILLLGLALARFMGCTAIERMALTETQRTIVFVLDDSYSMEQFRGSRDTFQAALADLKQRIEDVSGRDRVAILLTSRPESEDAILKLGTVEDPESLLRSIDQLTPSDLRTSFLPALQSAVRILDNASGEKRLYLLSDFRQVDLADEQSATELQEVYSQLDQAGVDLVVLDYGRPSRGNLTIESLELVTPFALAGSESRVAVTVRNNGKVRAENVQLEFSATFYDGKEMRTVALPVQTIASLEPQQSWIQEIPFRPDLPAFTVLTAKLPNDDLPGDNEAYLAVNVRDAIRVLLVDGHPGAGLAEDAESFFLRNALDPNRNGEHGFTVDVIRRDDLRDVDFRAYDTIFLLDVPDFPAVAVPDGEDPYPQVAALEDFVRDGGGLVIYTGPEIQQDFYNGRLYHKGRGLSPLPVRSPVGDARNRDSYFRIDPQSIRPTGVMRFFAGDMAPATQLIRFFAFTPARPQVQTASEEGIAPPVVEAAFDDPDASPAVVSRQYGKGTVVTVYSTASLRWNDWALDSVGELQGLYVAFLGELIEQHLARPQADVYNAQAGEAVRQELTARQRDVRGMLRLPDAGADLVSLIPPPPGQEPALEYDNALDTGIYQLSLAYPAGESEEVLFARNPDPREGRLDPAGEAAIRSAMGSNDFVYIPRNEAGDDAVEEASSKKQYWMWAVAALLCLMALESFLAQRFGHWT